MGRRILFLLAVFLVPLAVWAQPGLVVWQYTTTGGAALDTTCTGPIHIPDGWIVKVYWDSDSTGPDLNDPQPAICTTPPTCSSGPQYTVSYNRFLTNGVAQEFGEGYFMTDSQMKIALNMPPRPLYYLRIFSPADTTHALWTSTVKRLHTSTQTVAFLRSEWTCTSSTPQCIVKDAHE
jgi:hypothetical protein